MSELKRHACLMVMQSHSHSLFDGIYHHHHLKTTLPALCQIHLRHELFKKPKGKKNETKPKTEQRKAMTKPQSIQSKINQTRTHARTNRNFKLLKTMSFRNLSQFSFLFSLTSFIANTNDQTHTPNSKMRVYIFLVLIVEI